MTSHLQRPLAGKTIVITRAIEQQSEAHSLFHSYGAEVLDLPALVIGPPDDWNPLDNALKELNSFDWVVFSSANGVFALEQRLNLLNKSLSSFLLDIKIAAVGKKTALKLQDIGCKIDFIPPDFIADSLIKYFPTERNTLKILLPRVQTGGRNIFSREFLKLGFEVVEVPAYESTCPNTIPEKTAKALLNGNIDALIFTSGKTAVHTAKLLEERFHENWLKILDGIKLISIGPQTSIRCMHSFNRIDKEADVHDLQGVLEACIEVLRV